MKTGISKTQAAFTAFQCGDYQKAVILYRALSDQIGTQNFEVNIKICERRLNEAGTPSIDPEAPLGSIAHSRSAGVNAPAVLDEGMRSDKASSQSIKRPESDNIVRTSKLELTDQMDWYEISVKQGDEVNIKAAVTYHTGDGVNRRKAVMVFSASDVHGKEMDFSCGQLAKSRHLQGYFKYVNCSLGKISSIHSFKIPAGADRVRVGLCRFNATANDRIIIDLMEIEVKPKLGFLDSFIKPSKLAAETSILGWPEYPDNGKPYVMGIMDEFTTGCFEAEMNLIQPRPDNWFALAEKYPPAFIFIESAWKGNRGSWQYRVADYATKPGQETAQITQYALQNNIPTIFWNKEDPVHHQKFMCSAQLVDYIFTTDGNMCDSYRKQTGNSNVHALPFAAQPALHKPAPLSGRVARSCFAGSWYGDRHAERGQAMRWLLEAANNYGLDIYDRNHGTGAFSFPEEFQQGIKGSLPYKALCEEYSRYRVFLNVNSVIESPTMFSRRVFELMASGTPVVSTYARGIEELFESDAVWMVHSKDEADHAIRTLLTDDKEWRRRSLAGIREVFSRHTYKHRMNHMLEIMNLKHLIRPEPELLLLAQASNEVELRAIVSIAERQSYKNFKLLIQTPSELNTPATHIDVTTIKPERIKDSYLQSKCENVFAIGWLSLTATYGDDYLRDLINATLYQPEAIGWAKALHDDVFSYDQPSLLCASLWKKEAFFEHQLTSSPMTYIKHEKLYCIDSEEFAIPPNNKYVS